MKAWMILIKKLLLVDEFWMDTEKMKVVYHRHVRWAVFLMFTFCLFVAPPPPVAPLGVALWQVALWRVAVKSVKSCAKANKNFVQYLLFLSSSLICPIRYL